MTKLIDLQEINTSDEQDDLVLQKLARLAIEDLQDEMPSGVKALDLSHKGAMIAFVLDDETQQALIEAVGDTVGTVSADHLTLCYLAPDADQLENQKNRLVKALSDFAAYQGPITGVINGFGRFTTDEGGEDNAIYASFDAVELPRFQNTLAGILDAVGVEYEPTHGFIPHITLAYIPSDAPMPSLDIPRLTITFDEIYLVWAGEVLSLPLDGSPEEEYPDQSQFAGDTMEDHNEGPFYPDGVLQQMIQEHGGMAKADSLGIDLQIEYAPATSLKALADRQLEVKVAYGGPNNGRDFHEEYFSIKTDFDAENFPTPPLAYYHGFDEGGRPMGRPVFTGSLVKRESRADGHYLTYKLKNNRYADRTWEAALMGQAVASPATAPHMRRRGPDGHLDYWPIVEVSAWDYADNRKNANPYSIAMPVLKSLYDEAGIAMPEKLIFATPEAAGEAAASAASNQHNSSEEDMTPEELKALIDQGVQSALKAQQDAAAAAEQAKKDEETRIAAEVEKRVAEIDAQAAKSRRLPDNAGNSAPYVTRFGDVKKYDGMDVNDLSFLCGVLDAAKRKESVRGGVSNSALKALAIRIAEDKSDLGNEARSDLKAFGLDPADVVNATKANELNYSTQSGYGDEWVGVEYSRRLWENIRAGTFVLQKLQGQTVEIPQGVESVTIPIESSDPTWYKVGQTTGTNGTTGIPDATVTASKEGTANNSLTTTKVGARVIYSGEMEEDSLIPWVAQLRQKLQLSGAEQMEYLIIDGDTETGATTNINHIGGTPTATDLYLSLNGFRKLALVTNTANSRSASGAFVDTDFLETLKLMGTAGLNAADRNKVEFIVDANVMWKAQTIVSVKTRDVFEQATLENGMFAGIWGYKVNPSYFMHYKSAVRKANSAGKVDQTTVGNNTLGAILAVRWDQWMVGYKRRIKIALQELIDSDSTQIVATCRIGMVYRDTEASAISYNVGV